MSRFVEFTNGQGRPIWINPELVCSVESDTINSRVMTAIVCRDPDNPHWVTETVPEVLAKLQDFPRPEPEPAKTADDITGWWVLGKHVIYVIGFRPDGRIAYQWDGGRATTHDDVTALDTWTRDPNRKGWGG